MRKCIAVVAWVDRDQWILANVLLEFKNVPDLFLVNFKLIIQVCIHMGIRTQVCQPPPCWHQPVSPSQELIVTPRKTLLKAPDPFC